MHETHIKKGCGLCFSLSRMLISVTCCISDTEELPNWAMNTCREVRENSEDELKVASNFGEKINKEKVGGLLVVLCLWH